MGYGRRREPSGASVDFDCQSENLPWPGCQEVGGQALPDLAISGLPPEVGVQPFAIFLPSPVQR